MALVPDQKFSTFQNGGTPTTGDIIVGLRGGINTKFNWVLPSEVDTITGTADQVLVNTSSGVPVSGAVTLTTPQNIAPTSSPTFASLTLTSPLTVSNGGSGHATLTAYTLLAGGTTATALMQQVAAGSSGQLLQSNGAAALPSWVTLSSVGVTSITGTANQVLANATSATPQTGAVTLTTPQDIATTSSPTFAALTLTAALTVPNGGTGLQTATAYALLAGGTTATGVFQSLGTGTAGQLLQSGGAAALPSWTTATFPSGSGTLDHMLRSDGTNWVQTTATTLTSADVMSGLTQLNVDNLRLDGNTISSTDTNGNIQLTPNGNGINSFGPLTPSGTAGIVQVLGGANTALSIGAFTNTAGSQANFQIYKSRGVAPGTYVAVQNGDNLGAISFIGDDGAQYKSSASIQCFVGGVVASGIIPGSLHFLTANAVNGTQDLAMTISDTQVVTLANALPVGSGGLGITSTPSNGQIPIGNGTTYTAATITPGTGISVTNGSGSITLTATGGGLAVATIAGTTQAAAVNTKYFALAAGQTTVTLPAIYAVGDIVALIGSTANVGGWIVTASSGDTIRVNNATTSAGGTVTSAAVAGQTIYLECDVANTSWIMTSTVNTTLTTA